MRYMAQWARRLRSDEGSAAIEAAIVVPALIMFLCLAIAGGRIVTSGSKIDSAAEDAAREASIHRTAGAAQGAAHAAAAESLNDQGITCASTSVSVNTGGPGRHGDRDCDLHGQLVGSSAAGRARGADAHVDGDVGGGSVPAAR